MGGGEEHVLVWERGPLTELHAAMRNLAWKAASRRRGGGMPTVALVLVPTVSE